MSGAGLSVTLDAVQCERRLQKAIRNLSDMTPLFDEIGSMLVASTDRRFEDQAGPDGKRWPALSAATLLIRAQGGIGGKKQVYSQSGKLTERAQRIFNAAIILEVSGALRKSITHKPERNLVTVGTNRVYAALHQFGGKAGRGKKVQIEARPYLGLSQDDRTSIVIILNKAVGFLL